MPLITKVELKNGTAYEVGKTWPVANQKEGSKGAFFVGFIQLRPGEGEEDGAGVISMPPYYEIWCAPQSLVKNFFESAQLAVYKNDSTDLEKPDSVRLLAEEFVKHEMMYSREIYLSQVAYVEKTWSTPHAVQEFIETVINPMFAPEDPDKEDQPVRHQSVPTNGELKSVEPAT